MNPLMDALQFAGDPSRASATPRVDFSASPAFFGDRQPDPVRPARGDIDPAPVSSAALDADESSGLKESDAWRLGPIRATRDDMDGQVPVPDPPRARTAPSSGPPCSGSASDPVISAGPIRAGGSAADAPGGHVQSTSRERANAGKSASAASGSLGPRELKRGSGIARIVGIALSLILVTGAAAGGGYLIWKTEFVRPALVEGLSSETLPIVDLVPVHAANAASNGDGEADVRAALRTDLHARVPAPQALATAQAGASAAHSIAGMPGKSGWNAAAGDRTSEDAAEVKSVSTADASVLVRPEASRPIRAAGVPEPERVEPIPGPGDRSTAHVSPESSSGHGVRTAPERRVRFLEPDTPESAAPALEPGTPVSAGASVDAVEFAVPGSGQDEAAPRSDVVTGFVIRKRTRPDHVAASLERAYRAFLSGDETLAANAYRDVLRHEPGNRDAHLGLAALAVRAGRRNEAGGHYAQVLESHPADAVALAALIAIDESNPSQAGSRLKALLRSEPNAAHLHFDLGNLYAAQRRWREAQRSYSESYRLDRRNADYAYNLAVSLDHLSRARSALGLYREALLLSRSRAVSFETAAVLRRIHDLELHAEAGSTSDRPTAEAPVAVPGVRIR